MKKLLWLLAICGPALADDAATLHCRQLSDGAARLACYDAMPVGAPAAAVAAAPLTMEQQKQAFGMEGKKTRAVDAMPVQQLASLSTQIPGVFQGWQAGQIITLANGQRWKVVDGSDGVIIGKDLKATLVRGMLGAIYLDIEGASRSPKVQRIQ